MSNLRMGDSIKAGATSWLLRISVNIIMKLMAVLFVGCIVEMGCSFVIAAVMPVDGYNILDSIRNMDVIDDTIKILGALLPDVGDMVENLIDLCQYSSIETLKMPEEFYKDMVGAIVLAACSGLFGYLYTKVIVPVCNRISWCKGKIVDFFMAAPIMICSIRISAILANVIMLFLRYIYGFTDSESVKMLLAVAVLVLSLFVLMGIIWVIGATRGWFNTFVNSITRVLLNALMGVIIYALGVSIVNFSNGWQTIIDAGVVIVAPLALMYIFVCLRINSLNPLKE